MPITALGYIGVGSANTEEWSEFATSLLGMQKNDRTKKYASFRMDDLKQRLIVTEEGDRALAFMGWEVSSLQDLTIYADRLSNAEIDVSIGSKSLVDQRCVAELIFFNDPVGNRIELFFNPQKADDLFVPGRPISGFATGPHGLGHAVLHVKDAEALLPFYRDLLDFKVSDYGLTPFPLYFFHVNGRHHSFALIGSGQEGFHHFMIEYAHLDDVGQGYDLAQQLEDKIAYTLGRHTNDYMTSFYAKSPSGFFVENGWGGRIIDPATWEPHETTNGPSFWGHERLYLPEESRAHFRALRLDAAARGIQSPPIADCPWLYSQLPYSS